ncbi:hypothetical protein ES707_10654 [subsurface metagenome]
MTISDKCLNLAIIIDDVRENAIDSLHSPISDYSVSLVRNKDKKSLLENQKQRLEQRIKIANDAIRESIVETGYATEAEVRPFNTKLANLTDQVEKGKTDAALDSVETLSDELYKFMLNKVVTCECGKR